MGVREATESERRPSWCQVKRNRAEPAFLLAEEAGTAPFRRSGGSSCRDRCAVRGWRRGGPRRGGGNGAGSAESSSPPATCWIATQPRGLTASSGCGTRDLMGSFRCEHGMRLLRQPQRPVACLAPTEARDMTSSSTPWSSRHSTTPNENVPGARHDHSRDSSDRILPEPSLGCQAGFARVGGIAATDEAW